MNWLILFTILLLLQLTKKSDERLKQENLVSKNDVFEFINKTCRSGKETKWSYNFL